MPLFRDRGAARRAISVLLDHPFGDTLAAEHVPAR